MNGYKAVAGLEDDHGHGPTGPSRRRSQGSGPHPVEIVAYDPAWPARLAELGRNLRAGLGEVALRIDHIGSTSVPGLAAKPIIDIQISVADFEPLAAYRPSPATSCAARPTSTTAGRAVGAGVSRPVRQTPVATLDPRWTIREAGLVVGCAAGNEVTAHLLLSTGEWGRAGAVPLSMAEFVTRDPRPRPVAGRRAGAAGRVRGSQPWRPGLQLTGFVIFCCAADAEALKAVVRGDPTPRARDQWLEVEGTWQPLPVAAEDDPSPPPPVLQAEVVRPSPRPAHRNEYSVQFSG